MSDICGAKTGDGGECQFKAKYPDGKCGHHTEHEEQGGHTILEQKPEIKDLMEGEIQNGATIPEACAEAGINPSTHRNWLQKGKDPGSDNIFKDYRTAVTRARNIAAKNERRHLKQMCAEKGDTRTFWKIHKEQYGDLYAEDDIEQIDITVESDVVEVTEKDIKHERPNPTA